MLILANIVGFISLHRRYFIMAAAGLILLLAVLFTVDRCSSYVGQRKIDKLKANVNAKTEEVIQLEKQKAVLNERQEQALQDANRAVQEFNDEVGATEEARKQSNTALEAVNAARNSNQVGVTVDELHQKLDKLDR